MAKERSDWMLKQIERTPDAIAQGGKAYRGELMFKNEVLWIVDADTEEGLEAEAREKMDDAWRMGAADDDDPDADLITFVEL